MSVKNFSFLTRFFLGCEVIHQSNTNKTQQYIDLGSGSCPCVYLKRHSAELWEMVGACKLIITHLTQKDPLLDTQWNKCSAVRLLAIAAAMLTPAVGGC